MKHRERIEQLIAAGDWEQADFILTHARYAVRYAGFYPGDKTGLTAFQPGQHRLPKFHESIEAQRKIEPVRLFWTIKRTQGPGGEAPGELWEACGHVMTAEGQRIDLRPFTAQTEALARMPVLAEALMLLHPFETRVFELGRLKKANDNAEPRQRRYVQ